MGGWVRAAPGQVGALYGHNAPLQGLVCMHSQIEVSIERSGQHLGR